MHVVHSEASCGWGGQEIRILTEAAGMQRNGARITLLVNAGSNIHAAARDAGLDVVAMPLQRKNLSSIRQLRHWLLANQPDVVNTHSSVDAWLVALARLGTGIPVVRTRHISAAVPKNPLSRWLYLKGADRVVTTGESLRQTLIDALRADPAHFVSIPTGIDLARYNRSATLPRDAARQAFDIPVDGLVIGIAATLRSWKGHLYLLEAFERLAGAHPQAHLLIAGDGPARGVIEAAIGTSAHPRRIHLVGHLDDVERALAAMDIFCLPSYANEGVPQAILQAMAMQLPVVSTGVGAIAEAVEHEATGLLVAAQDSAALFDALNRLVAHPSEASAMADAGLQRAHERHSLAHMATRMQQVFTDLAHPRNADNFH